MPTSHGRDDHGYRRTPFLRATLGQITSHCMSFAKLSFPHSYPLQSRSFTGATIPIVGMTRIVPRSRSSSGIRHFQKFTSREAVLRSTPNCSDGYIAVVSRYLFFSIRTHFSMSDVPLMRRYGGSTKLSFGRILFPHTFIGALQRRFSASLPVREQVHV